MSPHLARLLPALARAARLVRPHQRRVRQGFQQLREEFYDLQWKRAAAAVGAAVDALGQGYLRLRTGAGSTVVRGDLVMLDSHLTYLLAGDKPLVHRLVSELGYPVPRHLEFGPGQEQGARRFAAEVGGPCVVKPARDTGGGQGVTTGVTTTPELGRALRRAWACGPRVLLEQQVPGASFRLLFLRGRLLHAVRRDPPVVVGDGRSTVARLVQQETRARLHQRPVRALSPLELDLECRRTLGRVGLHPRSVPAAGQTVVVKMVVNQNSSAQNQPVTGEVHDQLLELGQAVYQNLGVALAGIDLLAPTVAEPLEASGGVVNEVNTTPGLHHHLLVADPAQALDLGRTLLAELLGRRANSGGEEPQ